MKKLPLSSLFIAVAIMVLCGCKKLGKPHDVYFYTDIENPSGLLTLHLDNKNMGDLPVLKTKLSSENDTLMAKALHLKLRSGKYRISVQDKQGNVKCSGTFRFRSGNFNGATDPGALEYAMKHNTIVTRIFFE